MNKLKCGVFGLVVFIAVFVSCRSKEVEKHYSCTIVWDVTECNDLIRSRFLSNEDTLIFLEGLLDSTSKYYYRIDSLKEGNYAYVRSTYLSSIFTDTIRLHSDTIISFSKKCNYNFVDSISMAEFMNADTIEYIHEDWGCFSGLHSRSLLVKLYRPGFYSLQIRSDLQDSQEAKMEVDSTYVRALYDTQAAVDRHTEELKKKRLTTISTSGITMTIKVGNNIYVYSNDEAPIFDPMTPVFELLDKYRKIN